MRKRFLEYSVEDPEPGESCMDIYYYSVFAKIKLIIILVCDEILSLIFLYTVF